MHLSSKTFSENCTDCTMFLSWAAEKKNLSTCQRPGSEALSHATNGALRPSSPVRWLVVPAHRSWHIATKTKSSLPSEFTVLTILVVPCPLITAAIFPLFEASKLCSPEGLLIQQ